MGSYNRITIALFLLVCLVSVGRCTRMCGGDGLCRTTIASTASSNTSLTTPSTPTNSSTQPDSEFYTVIGTTIIIEKSNKTTPTQQTPTRSTSAPDSTNGTTQNVIGTTVSSKARPAGLEVTTVHSSVTEDTGNGTGIDVSTGGEGFTTGEVDVTSDGVDTTTGPLSEDLSKEGTTVANEEPTNKLTGVTTDNVNTIQPIVEWPGGHKVRIPSTSEYIDINPIQVIADKVITTDSEMLTSALTTALGDQSTTHVASTPETLTTLDHETTATLTTSEGQTTSWLPPETAEKVTTVPLQTSPFTTSERAFTSLLHTSLPPTTPERATIAPLQALPFTTSERATTSVLHTSPPPAERTTTAQQPTTASQASTASPSTTHVAQTTAHDEIQESPEDDSMNQISWIDLTEEERENSLTLSFNGIMEEDWMKHYDLKFRQFLSNTLTSNTARVEPENIYYIIPTPLRRRNTLYVSILARYSSMKRSAQPSVPLNVMGAINGTALKDALGLTEEPTIFEGIPDFILPTTQLPTTLPTTDFPITQSSNQTEPPIIQPSTTEPLITQPSKTRKPPQKIGFLSNPGLFISLVVIATVSIIIIIVGLIYLLCDRRRGRTGEYITNHTPRNSDLELGLDNPVMAENDKNVSNGNHLSSIKGDMESDMIVPYDNFTQEELMNYEVEDTHL